MRIALALVVLAALPVAALAQQPRDNGIRRVPQQPFTDTTPGRDNGVRRVPQQVDRGYGVRPTPSEERTLTLRPGHIQSFQFERRFATVLIGDTSIVDVVAQTDNSLAILAKTTGVTNLAVVDGAGTEIYNVVLEVTEVRQSGRVIVHARKDAHDFYAYQCTATDCQRVQEKYDIPDTPAAAPIFVLPPNATVTHTQGQTRITTPPQVAPGR